MRRPPRHARRIPSHPIARRVALVLVGMVAFATAAATAAYLDLSAEVHVSDAEGLIERHGGFARPSRAPVDPDDPFAGQALNILVMGTDSRADANAALAGAGDEFHSDTTVLAHVAGDRSRIELVSIPRDSLVDIPACPHADGSTSPPQHGAMFNDAFAIGGGPEHDLAGAAACTILTVESLTGVPITGHVVVEMSGVIGVVDAIGGVPMCLPEPVHGRDVALDLPAGKQDLDGATAISFLRARKGTGMGLEIGSDLKRIERQQAFLSAAVRKVLSRNIITDAPELYRVVQAVLASISPSKDLASPAALAGLAWSVRAIDPSRVVFTSVPVAEAPSDRNRVVWTSAAAEIWSRIVADEAPPGIAEAPGTAPPTTPPEPGAEPSSGGSAPTTPLLPGVCG